MTAIKVISRGLFWFLLVYWLIFIGYTVKGLATGGPDAAVTWYRHISGAAFQWSWGVFITQQAAILAVTLVAWFLGRRR